MHALPSTTAGTGVPHGRGLFLPSNNHGAVPGGVGQGAGSESALGSKPAPLPTLWFCNLGQVIKLICTCTCEMVMRVSGGEGVTLAKGSEQC